MYPLIYLFSLAAGVCFLVKLYILEFDQHTEKELIRLSFYWVPFILFGVLGLTRVQKRSRTIWYLPWRGRLWVLPHWQSL